MNVVILVNLTSLVKKGNKLPLGASFQMVEKKVQVQVFKLDILYIIGILEM
jgi:hypothetical protein